MQNRLSLGVKSIDELLDGGLSCRQPSIIYSIPNLGKSWFTYQAAVMCTRDPEKGGLGKKALILDTEAFYIDKTKEDLESYFTKRWPDFNPEKVEFLYPADMFELGRFFGAEFTLVQQEARIEVYVKYPKKEKKSGEPTKQTMQTADWITYSPAWEKLSTGEYGFLAIDSITMPIKDLVSMTQQNFPARANLQRPILAAMRILALRLGVSTFLTDHTVKDPRMEFYKPWGGDDYTYYGKHQIGLFPGLKDQKEKYGERVRRMTTSRWGMRDFKMILVTLAKDTGYVDLTPLGG
jgi:RecA/RadA recombinase